MVESPERSSQWQNLEARVARGGMTPASSSANLPTLNSSKTNCLMSLFMYSRLGKLGYVYMKFCPVSESKSWQSSVPLLIS